MWTAAWARIPAPQRMAAPVATLALCPHLSWLLKPVPITCHCPVVPQGSGVTGTSQPEEAVRVSDVHADSVMTRSPEAAAEAKYCPSRSAFPASAPQLPACLGLCPHCPGPRIQYSQPPPAASPQSLGPSRHSCPSCRGQSLPRGGSCAGPADP